MRLNMPDTVFTTCRGQAGRAKEAGGTRERADAEALVRTLCVIATAAGRRKDVMEVSSICAYSMTTSVGNKDADHLIG